LSITALENVVSNAERRAALCAEAVVVPRISDLYASLPALTGKIELEYEGELKGAEAVARELVRSAVANVFDGYTSHTNLKPVIAWFDQGGTIESSDTTSAEELLAATAPIEDFDELLGRMGVTAGASAAGRASLADFVLEGLCAMKKISRTEEGKIEGSPMERKSRQREDTRQSDLRSMLEDEGEEPQGSKGRKKYYN
jgi:magnesium chelatase subunit I